MRMFATRAIRIFYKRIAKPIFFRQDPEDVHDQIIRVGARLGRVRALRWLTRTTLSYANPVLEQDLLGVHFPNPVGLAAGFDKNALLTRVLPTVGFGYEEIGSITGEPCDGNPRPRLWRLPKSQGLVVHYGLKNDGCEAVAQRLRGQSFAFPVGVSVAKTNSPATVAVPDAIADYKKAFCAFLDIGDYYTINISCPNAFGGEPFVEPERLDLLLTELDTVATPKPIFLKLSLEQTTQQLDALVAVADRHRVHGFILSNLLKNFAHQEVDPSEVAGITHGGISGKPTFHQSNAVIAHLYTTVGKRYVIIGCGGIFSAADAYEKIRQGASLVQLITGMIYEGPQLIGEINRGLAELMARDGFAHVSEAVGSAHK